MSEINRQVVTAASVSINVTTDLKWILGATEPTVPTGYVRAIELDLDLGLAGKWWAFLKVS